MTCLAHTRMHWSTALRTASAAVYLRPGLEQSKRSSVFAHVTANLPESGP